MAKFGTATDWIRFGGFFDEVERHYGQSWFGGIDTGNACFRCSARPNRGFFFTAFRRQGSLCKACDDRTKRSV